MSGKGSVTMATTSAYPAIGTERNVPVLTVTAGPDAGRVVVLPTAEATSVGRSDECTVVLTDASLSRKHIEIRTIAGVFVITDLGSRNGTTLNDHPITKAAPLAPGDRILLGRTTILQFNVVTHAEEQAMRKLYEASTRDVLTGLWNRRATEERLDADIAFSLRHGTPLSVAMVDIDHFKRVNDTLGHAAGDAVLAATAGVLARSVRGEDTVGRLGGEEFVVILRGTPLGGAVQATERMRLSIEATMVPASDRMIQVTASFGVACLECVSRDPSRKALLEVADARLYSAKHGGRNRVCGG